MDPVTIGAIGSALGGAGSILSGLGFGSKKTDQAYNIALQEQSSLRAQKDSFNQKMELAKQHGLHKLSVLGVPMNTFAPALMPESSSGIDFASIGAGASQIANSMVKPPEPKEPEPDLQLNRQNEAQTRILEAQAKKAEWDALMTQWRAEDLLNGQPGNPPGVRLSNDAQVVGSLAARQAGVNPQGIFTPPSVKVEQQIDPPHPKIMGHSLGAGQSFQRMVDSDGHLYSAPNPNIYQPEINDYGTFHYLSNKYGVNKALEIMAALEQAPVAGGILGAIGYAGKKVYDYFGKQRADALKNRRHTPSWGKPAPRRSFGRGND